MRPARLGGAAAGALPGSTTSMSRLRKIALDAGGVAVGGAAGRGMGRGREHGDAPCLGIDRLGEQVVRRRTD